jgi:cytochrome P450
LIRHAAGASAAPAPDQSLSLSQLLYPDVLANPYPLYHRLRSEDPVHWDHLLHTWVVTRYSDVVTVLQHFSATRTPTPEQLSALGLSGLVPIAEVLVRQMLFLDAPAHGRIRNLAASAFTPRRVEALRPHIQDITDRLLNDVQEKGRMDVIADLADPLPAIVTAEMLGLPTSDWRQLTAWSADFAEALGNLQHNPDNSPHVLRSLEEMCAYFRSAVQEHRGHSHNDLICALLRAERDGDALSEEEVVANSIMLMTGGQETTTNLIGNGLLALLQHPDQWERLQTNPWLVPAAIEELLRYESPIQYTSRLAPNDTQLGDKAIRKGQAVIAVMGAANRDPDRFPDPDRLDIARDDNRHLAFAWGPHFCFGAPLARLEGEIAFTTLLRRMPELALEPALLAWRENLGFRGLVSLPVTFGRALSDGATLSVPSAPPAARVDDPAAKTSSLSEAKRALLERYLRGDLPQAADAVDLHSVHADPDTQESFEWVVPIQKGGSKTPFFFLHGQWEVGGFFCFPIARALGPDRPFYALEPYKLDSLSVPPPFHAIAAAHLKALRSAVPNGPYVLGGWCNGALLAYEMARQLDAAGQAIDHLVLIDPVYQQYPIRLKFIRALIIGLGKVVGFGSDRQLQLYLWLRQLYRYMGHVGAYLRSREYRMSNGLTHYEREDYPGVYDWTAMAHRPAKLYPGKITFFWSVTQPFRKGWRKVESLNEVEVHVLSCRHTTCLNDYLDSLAVHVRDSLADVNGTG